MENLMTLEEVHDFISQLQHDIENVDAPSKRISIYMKYWDRLPEPKYKQLDQISELLIYCLVDEFFDEGNYINAKEWAEKGLLTDRANTAYSTEEYIQMGRICYELEEYNEAIKYFQVAYERGKKRAFQEYDKKYWEFYSKNKK